MSDLKTATSALPGLQIAPTQLGTSEAAVYTCPANQTFLGDVVLTNVSGGAVVASVSLVKSGGSASAANRRFSRSLAAGETVVLSGVKLAPGDFISGQAASASAVSVLVDGVVFSATTGGVLTGIQDDAIGTGGYSTGSSTASGTNSVGNGANRYMLAALVVSTYAVWKGWADLDTLQVVCNDGALTRLVSAELGPSGQKTGSVHLFGRANPASNTNHTLTATVVESGITVTNLILASMSLTGVGSVSGAVASSPNSSAALDLTVASAIGNRPFWAVALSRGPRRFNRRVRAFDGDNDRDPASARYLMLADALGAATVQATTADSLWHAAVGVNLVPA